MCQIRGNFRESHPELAHGRYNPEFFILHIHINIQEVAAPPTDKGGIHSIHQYEC